MPMKSKKAKKIYLADDDLDLLAALKGEYHQEGLEISDGNVISLGLKALAEKRKEGGKREGTDNPRARRKRETA